MPLDSTLGGQGMSGYKLQVKWADLNAERFVVRVKGMQINGEAAAVKSIAYTYRSKKVTWDNFCS
jgi:hypothetical protein